MPASSTLKVKIQIDGAARGNPGPAGAGIALTDARGRKFKELAVYLGEATNNVAETCALILGLQEAMRIGSRQVKVFTDSELLAKQFNGEYRVKDPVIRLLSFFAKRLAKRIGDCRVTHVPREQNKQADRLANAALDRNPELF